MKKRQEGSAMVVVMCVMIVTVALSLSLLLTSSVLINNAIRSNDKEQCRINAITVSDALVNEIKKIEKDRYTDADNGVLPSVMADREKNLRAKLKSVTTNEWYAYDVNAGTLGQLGTRGRDYFTYDVVLDGLPGTTRLDMYWINAKGEPLPKLDILVKEDPNEAAEEFSNVMLYLKVTSTVGRESSTIISTFYPIPDPEERENGEGTWKNWYWQYSGHEWERGAS